MRNFSDIAPSTQRRIISDFNKNVIGFSEIETLYDICPKSFFEFLEIELQERFEAFQPTKAETETQISGWERLKNWPAFELVKQLLLSLFLCVLFVNTPVFLAWVGVNPVENDLIARLPLAAFYVVSSKIFSDVFFYLFFRLMFRYLHPKIITKCDCQEDFQALSPAQRWVWVSLKYYFWVALFVFILAILNNQNYATI